MKLIFGFSPLLGLVLAQALSISGTVSGSDLTGAVVIACFMVNDNCDDQQSKAAAVGAGGMYRLEGLGAGPYVIIAWRDLNGTGELDAGDEAAVYSKDGKTPTPLKPPQQKIDLSLRTYDGTDASLLAPPAAGRRASQGSVLGTWTYTSSKAAISYTLKADGTYEYAGRLDQTILSGCTRGGVYSNAYVFIYTTGTYRIQGDKITFTPRSGSYTTDQGCVKKEQGPGKEQMKVETFTWRLGEYAGSPALFLTNANGEQVYWK